MKDYKKAVQYIEFLKRTYGLDITIKDYKGFVYENEEMEFSLRPYLAHTNPYCMYVKEKEESYNKCLNNNKELIEECKRKDYFFHICHAGICELIIPIKEEKTVFGSINISHFDLYPDKTKKAIELTFEKERREEGKRKFKIFARSAYVESSTLIPSLELLSQYLLLLIQKIPLNKEQQEELKEKQLRAYIKNNISKKIVADDIISNLNINRTQLNTLIRTKDVKNLRDYINTIRIEMSEKLLLETKKTPKEIALSLGFKGYRHFENIFTAKLNISPKDYRKYYKNEKYY
ncbi:MAG: helix-turn-helix domain-containing protein [Sphaerochaetaceae bacterium]|nr:helix-turn-helix domain-containing protein [Sphaerochaetaceae bacterium]MDC7244060.1 helix-turn-helix domain-containing protein [Sphaerochaetaceae bacterium]